VIEIAMKFPVPETIVIVFFLCVAAVLINLTNKSYRHETD
jgi:hypothetical protein